MEVKSLDELMTPDPRSLAALEAMQRSEPKRGRPKGKARKGPARDRRTVEYYARKYGHTTEAPDLPDDDAVPAALRQPGGARDKPPRRPSAAAEARELRQQLTWLLVVVNQGFLAFAPCGCDLATVTPDLLPMFTAGAMHFDTCPKMWALDEAETEKLVAALSDEMELHPEWGAKLMERLGSWQPHIMLAGAVFAVIASRVGRKGLIVPLADKLSAEQEAELARMMREAEAAAGSAMPMPPRSQPFSEASAAAAPFGADA